LSDVKSNISPNVSFTLSFQALEAKEQHKRSIKHVKIR